MIPAMPKPRKPLSAERKADANRLAKVIDADARSQTEIAIACGWKTQGSVSQYSLGTIPLNIPALIKFAQVLEVPESAISPGLAEMMGKAMPAPEPSKNGAHKKTPGYLTPAKLSKSQTELRSTFDVMLEKLNNHQAHLIRDMLLEFDHRSTMDGVQKEKEKK